MPLLQQLLSTEEGVYSWRVPGTSVRSRFPNLPLPSQTAALGHNPPLLTDRRAAPFVVKPVADPRLVAGP